ncbi:MAG: ABC transporter ATP-binding protein [Flavobacteriaceae bacterium]
MIIVEGLHKKFGRNSVLQGIDLKIEKPGIYAILGPNGSGKTTVIKTILGMVLPSAGSIEVLGENISKKWRYRKELNYLPQIANFPGNLIVGELFNMIKDLRRMPSDKEHLIELFGLQPFLNSKLANLSGGTKQKVNIVIALMFNGQLLILDEPTTGLDPASLIELKKLIKEEKAKGKVILITTHIMDFVEEMADEIVYLLEGKIYFQGTIKDLTERTQQSDFQHAIAEISTTQHA